MNARAQVTSRLVSVHRRVGASKRPTKKLPRQAEPRGIEREYTRALLAIVVECHRALQPLFDELPQLLAEARAELRVDAAGSRRLSDLIEQARTTMNGRLTKSRAENLAASVGNAVSQFHKREFAKQLRAGLGVDMFTGDSKNRTLLTGFVQENVSHIKDIPRRVIGDVEKTVSRAMQRGKTVPDIAEELTKHFDEGRAARIARDQTLTLYGQFNESRQQELGIEGFIWRTVGDDAVRQEHQDRDGRHYSWDDPPDGEIPGEPINCRCYAEPLLGGLLEGI